MDRGEMARVVFEAIEKGASGNKLEPERKGTTITKIKKDHSLVDTISDEKLALMYERATAYLTTNNTPKRKVITTNNQPINTPTEPPITTKNTPMEPPITTKNTPMDTPTQEGNIIERIAALETKNIAFELEIADLKRRLAETENTPKLTKKTPKEYTKSTTKILGWSISLQTKTSGGYRYEKWYATRTIDGKQRHIYLGDDPDQADAKIRVYCERIGIPL